MLPRGTVCKAIREHYQFVLDELVVTNTIPLPAPSAALIVSASWIWAPIHRRGDAPHQ